MVGLFSLVRTLRVIWQENRDAIFKIGFPKSWVIQVPVIVNGFQMQLSNLKSFESFEAVTSPVTKMNRLALDCFSHSRRTAASVSMTDTYASVVPGLASSS